MTATAADKAFELTRIFDAPVEAVWKAWTDPKRLERWWGPKGLGLEVVSFDFRPGGIFHYAMVMPTGHKMYGRFAYGDITAPGGMEFVNGFADEQGNVTRAPFSPVWPLQVHNTLTLTTTDDGKTALNLRGIPVEASEIEMQTFAAGHSSMQQGFSGTLDQLDEFLKVTT